MVRFRPLRADEVECRINTVSRKGDEVNISLLLYKNARCDMNVLDETVGPENWQREHYECKGNLFCRIGINIAEEGKRPVWVWKSDCGSESRAEAEKGEASDSFKRAGFNWGIGRELYTAPFIYVPCKAKADGKDNFTVDGNGNPKGRFAVTQMSVEGGKIVSLNIENLILHRTIFTYGQVLRDSAPPTAEVICPECGREVKPLRKGAEQHSPQEVLDKLGMCFGCFRARQQGESHEGV